MGKKIGTLILVFLAASFNPLLAYDGKVHQKINEHAADPSNSRLNQMLIRQLGLIEGVNTELKKGNESKTIKEWISFGGAAEDYGKKGRDDYLTTRAFNHFHDPLEGWDEAGLDHWFWNEEYYNHYGTYPVSSILWGLDPGRQAFAENTTGDWSWEKARQYYYIYLTGKDFDGSEIATTDNERKANFSSCLRALGQVMHLLQDVSVPLHTRNDIHIFPITKNPFTGDPLSRPIGRWTYETYTYMVAENIIENETLNYTADFPDQILLNDPKPQSQPLPDYSHLSPISGLFDRNQYNEGAGSPPDKNAIGLAEYSNAYFLTHDTMWDDWRRYPFPSLEQTNYNRIDWWSLQNVEQVDAEDGKTDNRIYIKYKEGVGEEIGHLAAADYWTKEYEEHEWEIPHRFTLDEVCWKDYADKLVPRAVGYSAALLDYFFRGTIEITSPDLGFIGSDAGFHNVTLSAQNTSTFPENEEMSGGSVHLVVKYKLDGGDQFQYIVKQLEGENHIIPRQTTTSFDFDLSATPIPLAAKDVSLYLVYKGQLGVESGAIAVGYTPVALLEITPPERFVYSIIDGSMTPQQFTYIKAKVMNTNAEFAIGEGSLQAVARYKNRTDYEPDLSTDPPTEGSREEYFSYSVSAPIDLTSLSSETPQEFNFDFSANPIPVGITDLYLQVEFTGNINDEPGSLALGIKDLSEPTHISVSNSTDRFYLDYVLRTSDEIKADPSLLARVDLDGDGVPNEDGEPYIDPFDLSIGVALYPSDGIPPDPEDYSAIYFDMLPGGYGKIIMLTDMPEFNLLLHYEYTLPYVFMIERYAVLLSGVINQQDAQGTFHNTQVYILRGLIQHNHFLYARAHPDNTGIYSAPWPEFENDPVPIDTLRP